MLKEIQAAADALRALPAEYQKLAIEEAGTRKRRGRKPGPKPGTKRNVTKKVTVKRTKKAPAGPVRASAKESAKAALEQKRQKLAELKKKQTQEADDTGDE